MGPRQRHAVIPDTVFEVIWKRQGMLELSKGLMHKHLHRLSLKFIKATGPKISTGE